MPCRLSSLLLARHVPPQRSIQIYRSVLEILLVIFEFARKKNGDKMFRVQTHQVLLTCNLTCTLRIAISWHLGRQISRCFWVLDHLKNLTCRVFFKTLRNGLRPRCPHFFSKEVAVFCRYVWQARHEAFKFPCKHGIKTQRFVACLLLGQLN